MTILHIQEKTAAIEAYNAALPKLNAFFATKPKFKTNGEFYEKDKLKFDVLIQECFGHVDGFLYHIKSQYSQSFCFKFCWNKAQDNRGRSITEYYEGLVFHYGVDYLSSKIYCNKTIETLTNDAIDNILLSISDVNKQIIELECQRSKLQSQLYYYQVK